MKIREKFIHCFVLLIAMPILVGTYSSAVDAKGNLNKRLKGKFAFTLFQSCVFDPQGFDNDLAHIQGGAGPNLFNVSGIIGFHGDGTGTVSRNQLVLLDEQNSPGDIPLIKSKLECDVKYQVNSKESFTYEEENCTGPVLAGTVPAIGGPISGQTIAQENIQFEGFMNNDRKHLIFTDTNTNVETVIFTPGPTFDRICNRSGNAFRLSPGNSKGTKK